MAAADEQKKSTVREYYEALLIAVIFVNKFIYGPGPNMGGLLPLRDVRRGDIIVFRYPLQPDTDFVKRVIGMPGDTLEIKDKKIFINGKQLDEPYVLHEDAQVF